MAKGFSRSKRNKVLAKTDGHCAYCGDGLNQFRGWTIDHAIPQAQGGSHKLSNLFPSCQSCNSSKKDRTVREYAEVCRTRRRKKLAEFMYTLRFGPQMKWDAVYKHEIGHVLDELVVAVDNSDVMFFADDLFCELGLRDAARTYPPPFFIDLAEKIRVIDEQEGKRYTGIDDYYHRLALFQPISHNQGIWR